MYLAAAARAQGGVAADAPRAAPARLTSRGRTPWPPRPVYPSTSRTPGTPRMIFRPYSTFSSIASIISCHIYFSCLIRRRICVYLKKLFIDTIIFIYSLKILVINTDWLIVYIDITPDSHILWCFLSQYCATKLFSVQINFIQNSFFPPNSNKNLLRCLILDLIITVVLNS